MDGEVRASMRSMPPTIGTCSLILRSLFRAGHYEQAAKEFDAVVERAPTNDYALFCLGRSLQQLGRHAEARRPLALASCMRPERRDYRIYRDRARAAAA